MQQTGSEQVEHRVSDSRLHNNPLTLSSSILHLSKWTKIVECSKISPSSEWGFTKRMFGALSLTRANIKRRQHERKLCWELGHALSIATNIHLALEGQL